MSNNTHIMNTRSKVVGQEIEPPKSESSPISEVSFESEVDEHGNLKGLIDYEEDEEDFDQNEFNKVIQDLSGNRKSRNKSPKKKIKKRKDKKNNKLNDVFMTYLIMKATEKANE